MANGIAIKDVDNKLQSLEGEEVIPISTGANEPEVVEVDTLKEYINEDVETALEGKQDVISDLATIRSGAALGATALQSYTESDPTVHEWAKAEQKPSYSYSEIIEKPTLSTVATSGSYNDLTNKPDIPSEQIQSDWNQSNTSAKDFIKNKPEIPALPTLADVATSGDYDDLSNKPTIPSAVTESTVSGWGFTKNAGTITGITMNGASKGTSGVVDLGTVITSHQSLSDYVQKSQTSGLLKNDGTVDTTAYTTNTGTVTSTGGTVTVNNIQVVSALPASPDANTLYLIPES